MSGTQNLDQLNSEQRSAVQHQDGPLLIVAGAGTGKTTVLINRLLYLISQAQVSQENILLVTFTEKASQEIVERADRALPYGCFNLWINTFHGLCDQILRQHGLDIGLNTDYQVLSQTEQWILLKNNLSQLPLDYYAPLGNPDKFIIELIKHFSRLKDENISPATYLDYALELQQDQDVMLSSGSLERFDLDRIKELSGAYHVYNQLLLDNKFLDFGDLITHTLRLFNSRPDILKHYQEQFKYIMVDEFQDTNWSQYELIKLLAHPGNNLVAVGDDNQSIFKFRGASLSNIMQFKDDFPQAKEIVLNKNYRSGQVILDRAYELIKHNDPNTLEAKLGIDKKIQAQTAEPGEIKYLFFPTALEETRQVVEMIKAVHQPGAVDWSDLAILIRANSTADRFIAELTRQGFPHQFVSLRGLYYKPIILDVLAYLQLLDNYHESAAVLRVLGLPAFLVSQTEIIEINKFGRQKLWSLYESLQNIAMLKEVSLESVSNINKLLQAVQQQTREAKEAKTSKLFVQLVHDHLAPHLDYNQNKEEYNYLNQFYQKILKFEQANPSGLLPDFLRLIDLEKAAGDSGALRLNFDDADTIKIMTVHSAKGLEFKYVWLVDLVDKRFPTINRGDRIPVPDGLVKEFVASGDTHLEEERRLCYVAMTRAKQGLFVTGAKDQGGAADKKPSRFVAEAGLPVLEIKASQVASELERDLQDIGAAAPVVVVRPELPTRFSFSQLEAYNNCPWQYQYIYVLKVPTAPKAVTTFGRVIHLALKDFLEPQLTNAVRQTDLFGDSPAAPDLSWHRLATLYAERWQDHGYDSRQQAEDFRHLGQQMLKDFQTSLASQDLPQVLFLEKEFSLRLGDYTIVGTIDRVDQLPDGSLAIIDYKTGTPKEKVVFADKKQLFIYQLALEQLGLGKVSRLSYYYLKNNSRVDFAATDKDLSKVQEDILQTIAEIRQHCFEPKPSHLCQYCDFRSICQFRQA